jgi:hypothetical protein
MQWMINGFNNVDVLPLRPDETEYRQLAPEVKPINAVGRTFVAPGAGRVALF